MEDLEGRRSLLGLRVSALAPAPAPNAAEMHKVCSHQGHEQQAVKAQR